MQITKKTGDSSISAKNDANMSNSRLNFVGPKYNFIKSFIFTILKFITKNCRIKYVCHIVCQILLIIPHIT